MKQIKTASVIVIMLFLSICLLKQSNQFNKYKNDNKKTIQDKSDSIKTLLSDVELLKNDFGYKIHNIWKETSISIPNDFSPQYLDSIEYYRIKYKIPIKIVYRIIHYESRFIDTSYNKSGATGLFQMKKCYWYQFRGDEVEWNEFNRIKIALRGLGKMHEEAGRWDLVLSMYNCGHYNKTEIKPSKSTEKYINLILK